MSVKSEAAAFLKSLQRSLIATLALVLLVSVWTPGPAGSCGPNVSCASSSRATLNFEEHSAVILAAMEGIEKVETDLGDSEDVLFDFIPLLQSDHSWSTHVADGVGDPDGNRHHVLPEKTGPPPLC